MVTLWQSRCYHLPAEVQEVVESEESYTDVPGIVWQGSRYGVDDNAEAMADEDSDSEPDDEEDEDL
jgi:hypothetical protein